MSQRDELPGHPKGAPEAELVKREESSGNMFVEERVRLAPEGDSIALDTSC